MKTHLTPMLRSAFGISLAITAVVLVAGGVLWGVSGGRSRRMLTPSSPVPAPDESLNSAALDQEIERLVELRSHLLPPLPTATEAVNSDALRTEAPAPITAQPSSSRSFTAPPAAARAPANASYSYSPPSQAPLVNQSYTYAYGSSYGAVSPRNSTSTSPPPAPVFTAAPGTRTYTVTTSGRFCEYKPNLSVVLLSGYPFPQDVEVFQQDIVSWSMSAVTFRLPSSFPAGMYSVIVRGYQKYGYCDDVRPGFIKVE